MTISAFQRISLLTTATILVAVVPAEAMAQAATVRIPAQPLDASLRAVARQTDTNILYTPEAVRGLMGPAIHGNYSAREAVARLLKGLALTVTLNSDGTIVIRKDAPLRSSTAFRVIPMAQGAPVSDSAVSQSDDQGRGSVASLPSGDDDIVVTARRRLESLQDVPVAITALSGQFLERQSVARIEDLGRFTPGLIASEGTAGNGGAIFLRGIGSTASQTFIDQSVAVNVDGVQVSTAQILRATGVDVQQVEVLRGPQALFFGKNSPGGVISYRTADPGDDTELMLRSGYEIESRELSVEGLISGPLTQNLGARIAVRYATADGYLKVRSIDATTPAGVALRTSSDRFPNGDDIFVRGTLLFQSGGFQSRAKLTYTRRSVQGGTGFYTQRVNCPLGVPQQSGVAAPAVLAIDDCKANDTTVGGNIPAAVLALDPVFGDNPMGSLKNTQWLASLENKFNIADGLEANLISGYYNTNDYAVGPFSIYPISNVVSDNPATIEQYSQEVRLTSRFKGAFNFMVSGFYERVTKTSYIRPYFGTSLLAGEYFKSDGDTWSGFIQAEWAISPKLRLSGGVRYTDESRSVDVERNGVKLTNLAFDRISNDNFSPEVTLSWRPSADIMVYSSYRRGFKSGGFDAGYGTAGRLVANPNLRFSYNPEEVEGGEGGIRATLAGGRLRVNLTGYIYDYTNLQLASFDAAALSIVTRNAAGAKIRGLEADILWKPAGVPGLTVRAAGAYNHARYTQFIAGCYGGQTIAMGCDFNLNASGAYTSQDLSGAPLPFAPSFSATFGIDYEAQLGNLRFGISSDSTYTGSYFAQVEEPAASRQGASFKTDLSARLFPADNGWEFKIIGRNLTNEFTLTRAIDTSLTGSGTGRAGPGVLADTSSYVSRGRQIIFQITFRR